MAFDKKAYAEYEEKLYSSTYDGNVSDDTINDLFNELLSLLPNDGKLYKYKSLKRFHVDELEEKYVWFSSAKDLNDKKDCAFNANFLEDVPKIVRYVLTDNNYQKLMIMTFLNRYQDKGITYEIIEDCLNCISRNGMRIANLKFNQFCKTYHLSSAQIAELKTVIALCSEENHDSNKLKQGVINAFQQIKDLRDQQHVLSLTTSYKKDSMWAYYCDNEGVCVEYDFSKIDSLKLKKVFLNTQKVSYGRKKRVSYLDIFKLKFTTNKEDIIKADKLIMNQLLTKDKSWATEDEWRVLLYDKTKIGGMKIPADIISAIYIDYSILKRKKTRQIIKYAKENAWDVYVRFFDDVNGEYRYETIKEIRRLIKHMKILNDKKEA